MKQLDKTDELQGAANNLYVLAQQSKELTVHFAELLKLSEWCKHTIDLFMSSPECVLVEFPETITEETIRPAMARIERLLELINHKTNSVSMCQYQLFLRNTL